MISGSGEMTRGPRGAPYFLAALLLEKAELADSNLYVLEVYRGIILYLNQRTDVRDGWWWGTDEQFVAGPFESSELATAAACRHADRPLELIILTADNFDAADGLTPSGNLIVVDTDGAIWTRM